MTLKMAVWQTNGEVVHRLNSLVQGLVIRSNTNLKKSENHQKDCARLEKYHSSWNLSDCMFLQNTT